MKATIALLPGDGVGPEVVNAAVAILDSIAAQFGHDFAYKEALFGIVAINATGQPLPQATIDVCAQADAVLMGAVGGPAGSTPPGAPRPEAGLLALRKHFNLFANLRPVKIWPALIDQTPIKPEILKGTDILFVRELTSGIYFGKREEYEGAIDLESDEGAYDTLWYSMHEVSRIANVAFKAAQGRDKRVTSVDKANVLAASRLWRRTVEEVAKLYPEVELDHQLVDSFAMRIITQPSHWDVVVTSNMFGDILSDEASVLAGSLGMLPSASLNESNFGLYEPIHGSAPDIAGKGVANPIATILSAAMLVRHSLGLETEAQRIEDAVAKSLAEGARTGDIAAGSEAISTNEMTETILRHL